MIIQFVSAIGTLVLYEVDNHVDSRAFPEEQQVVKVVSTSETKKQLIKCTIDQHLATLLAKRSSILQCSAALLHNILLDQLKQSVVINKSESSIIITTTLKYNCGDSIIEAPISSCLLYQVGTFVLHLFSATY